MSYLLCVYYSLAALVLSPPTPDTSSSINTLSSTLTGLNLTVPKSPFLPHPVYCLRDTTLIPLVPQDCAYIVNEMILRQDGVSEHRLFNYRSYQNNAGLYVASRWKYRRCEVFVGASMGTWQSLTLLDVALTANNIISECVQSIPDPKGGESLIGVINKNFYVHVEGYSLGVGVLATNGSSPVEGNNDL